MVEIKKCNIEFPKTTYSPNPKFGSVFIPYLLKMPLTRGQTSGFQAEIVPYEEQKLFPGTASLHYGQSIFEGMKAYTQPDGQVAIFRADVYANRFKRSAERMVMGVVPPEVFVSCAKAFVKQSKLHVPTEAGHSLYLRPLLFASDSVIKVGTSTNYIFYIMGTIAGSYFSAGTAPKPVRVLVNRHFVRAYPGGTGEAKTAGNYAASIWPQFHGSKFDCDQVLFLDAVHHEYVDELGGMNFFFVRGKELVTPKLNGCILHGVTRKSILELAPQLGLKPIEEPVSIKNLISGIDSGTIQEAFACGTAAVVSPIGELVFQDTLDSTGSVYKLKGDFSVSNKILHTISDIQRGKIKAPGDWLISVD